MLTLLLLEAREELLFRNNEEPVNLQLKGRRMLLKGVLKEDRTAHKVADDEKNSGGGLTSNGNGKRKAEKEKCCTKATPEVDSLAHVSDMNPRDTSYVKFESSASSSDCYAAKSQSLSRQGYDSFHNPESDRHSKAANAVLALLNRDYHWDNGKPRLQPPINNQVTP